MSGSNQRRLGTRYTLKIPIRIRLSDGMGTELEEMAEVVNVSGTGAYFFSKLPLRKSQEVLVSLPLPRKMRLVPTADPVFKCKARVVRIETNLQGHPDTIGVAVKFLVYA